VNSKSSNDRRRQIAVAVCAVIAIVGSFIGSGVVIGTPIAQAAGGALAADATLIAPGTGAFQIWGVIYVGLVAYAIWQFLPAQRTAERHRRLGYPVALSLLLNAAWILSIQFDLLWLSVPVIAALLVVLIVAFLRASRSPSTGVVDAIVTDGTIGLYLGWVAVATAANVTAALVAAGFDGFGIAPEAWAVVVIAVAAAAGVALALAGRGRISPTLSLGWGLVWIAVARLTGSPESSITAVAAAVATVVVVVATVVARLRARSGEPRVRLARS
jgi:hypothetical protein